MVKVVVGVRAFSSFKRSLHTLQCSKLTRKGDAIPAFLVTLCLSLLFNGCGPSSENKEGAGPYLYQVRGPIQGTRFNIKFYTTDTSKAWKKGIQEELEDLDQSLSTYIDSSLISRFNRSDSGVFMDPHLRSVLKTAKQVHKETNGAFDPTIMPLVRAWGFGPEKDRRETPDSAVVDSLMKMTGFSRLETVQHADSLFLKKTRPGLELDLNAIAQGYSVDHMTRWLRKKGIARSMVEIGGEVRTQGKKDNGKAWRIAIDKPKKKREKGEFLRILRLEDASMATSGNYRKFYEKDGKRIGHTIDPTTGYPIERRTLSATIIDSNCARADAYATAFMAMPWDEAIGHLETGVSKMIKGGFLVGIDTNGEMITREYNMPIEKHSESH